MVSPFHKSLRMLADDLYGIAEDGFSDLDKTAAEVESEMHVYLLSKLADLLDKAQIVADECSGPEHMIDGLAKSLESLKGGQ